MPTQRRMSRMKTRAVSTAGVIAALAIAAPVTEASAATPKQLGFPGFGALPTFPGFPGFAGAGFTGVPVPIGAGLGVAIGPTVIGSVFNGGTTVVVSSGVAAGSTNASP